MTGIGLPDLVAQAYEAACDFDGLHDWLGHLSEYFGDVESALIIWPFKNPEDLILVTHRASADSLRERFADRHQPDTLFGRMATMQAGETCIVENAFASQPDGASSSRMSHALVGIVIVDDIHRCGLALFRGDDRGPFSQLENDSLQSLMDYFRRAVVLNRRFIDVFNQNKTMASVLDSAPRGIVTLGQKGQITFMNSEAGRIFSRGDGLSLTNNLIGFRDAKARKKYSDFVELARISNDTSSSQQRLNTVIDRTSGVPPYQLMAYTLPVNKSQASLFDDEALAVLIIQDPTSHLQLRSELLQTFYNLSAAEARLAVSLYRGNTLPEAADHLHISINTARSQLRGIFKKVGVNSQATLLQALTAGSKDIAQNPGEAVIN